MRQQADKLDEEEENAMKLLDDLCEHYGVENTIRTKSLDTTRAKDLDSQIEEYEKYIALQKENIATINVEISRIQNSKNDDKSTNEDLADKDLSTPLDMDKIKNLLKNFATRKVYER